MNYEASQASVVNNDLLNADVQAICNRAGLSEQFREQHRLKVELLNFPAGEVLFKPGLSCQAFLILISGSIEVVLTARSGRDVTLYTMQSGETCILTTSALLTDQPYYAQGVAETDIQAIAMSINDFHIALQKSGTFAEFVLRDYATRVSSIINLVDTMSARDVMHAVCEFLVHNHDSNFQVIATQRHIAKEIGSAREVVGRKLTKLESRGLIKRGRGEITILDLNRLADGC